jgi:phosphopentomutase
MTQLRDSDRLVLTADHGNDPTYKGTDHTREQIPIMIYGKDIAPGPVGARQGFSDIGQSIAQYLGVGPLRAGTAFGF